MAKARVVRRREQLIPHSSALTATSPLGRVFLDYSHVVFQKRSLPIPLLDDLIGAQQDRGRDLNPQRSGGPEIHGEFKCYRLLNGKIGRIFAS
jgi:hypothetical protein